MKMHDLHEWLAKGLACAMVTVTAPDGGKGGIALNEAGEFRGNLPDAGLWAACLPVIRARLADRRPSEFSAVRMGSLWVAPAGDLASDDLAPFRIRVEPVHEEACGETVIFGTGSVALALARICHAGSFPVRIFAEDEAALSAVDFTPAIPRRLLPAGRFAEEAGLGADSYCAVLSDGHRCDEACVSELLRIPEIPYIGWMCGPELFRAGSHRLRRAGLFPDPRLHAPIGLRLGGQRAADIALAILAEIRVIVEGGRLEHARRGAPVPGEPRKGMKSA